MDEYIEMHLVHGNMKGIVKCTLETWGGAVYRIPRSRLNEANRDAALCRSGVYCLMGKSNGVPRVYVGQGAHKMNAYGVLKRVQAHDTAAEAYWDTVLVFTLQNQNFTDTEISYLEHKFYKLAKAASPSSVENQRVPSDGNPTPKIKSAMKKYISRAKIILEALECHVFDEPVAPAPAPKKSRKPSPSSAPAKYIAGKHYNLSCKVENTWSIKASGEVTQDGKKFCVKAGSEVAPPSATPKSYSLGRYVEDMRKMHCRSGEVAILSCDVEFDSLSAAACFVAGCSLSGTKYWL